MEGSLDSFPKDLSDIWTPSEGGIPERQSEEYVLLMGLKPVKEKKSYLPTEPDSKVEKAEIKPEKTESVKSVKLCQKLDAINYKDIDIYAQLFVDEIIDISVEVCNKVKEVLDGSRLTKTYLEAEGDEFEEQKRPEQGSLSESFEEINIFQGWPTIEEFTVELGVARIDQFMSQWRRKEAWKYSVTFIASWSDYVADFHLFKVCENLYDAALGGEGDVISEVPCICEAPAPKMSICRDSMETFDEEDSEDKNEFTGWPTIHHFTIDVAKKKIMEFMDHWYFVEDWKYTVHYIASYSDSVSDYHLFQGMWSIPTKEYPIAQATATIFFTIEVSRVKPKFCLVNVTLQFEGSSSVYRAGQFEFIEQWLFNIIDSKLNLFKTLRF